MIKEITADEIKNSPTSFIDLMRQYKPDITEQQAEFILWNETCYPFDDRQVVKDIYNYFNTPSPPSK